MFFSCFGVLQACDSDSNAAEAQGKLVSQVSLDSQLIRSGVPYHASGRPYAVQVVVKKQQFDVKIFVDMVELELLNGEETNICRSSLHDEQSLSWLGCVSQHRWFVMIWCFCLDLNIC